MNQLDQQFRSMSVNSDSSDPSPTSHFDSCFNGEGKVTQFIWEFETFFPFNDIVNNVTFKLIWGALSGKAKKWIQAKLNPSPHISYSEIKDALMLDFPGYDLKWDLGPELYGKLQDYSETGIDFVLRKLTVINQMKLTLSEEDKVDSILMRMLPYETLFYRTFYA